MSPAPLKVPLFVALDVDDDRQALMIAQQTAGYVGGYKVGPRLTYKYGADLVRRLSEIGPVFVDNKYHDIPSTMVAALKATFAAGASFATIHACIGRSALREMAELERELNKTRPFTLLAVTVLTSLDEHTLPQHWRAQSIGAHVMQLTEEVIQAGLRGVVCSPYEVGDMHKAFPHGYFVTPGIRLVAGDDDQSRTAGPQEALAAGASVLVVGRPIVSAADPTRAAREFYNLLI